MANLSSFLGGSYVGYTGSAGGTDVSLDSSPTLGGDLNTTGNDVYSANNDLAILGGGIQTTRPQVHLTNNGGLALYGGSATNSVNKQTDTYGVKIDGGDGIIDVASDLVLTGDTYNITFDKSTDDLIFDSGATAKFNDQWIYHDGTVFRIGNGAGSTNDTYFNFKNQVIFYRAGSMNSLMTIQSGVQRFHVNGKITTAADIEVGGSILNVDNITTGPASGNPAINLGDGSGNSGNPIINFNATATGIQGHIQYVGNGGFNIKSNSAGDYIRLQTYGGGSSHYTPLEVDENTVTISSAYDLPTSDGSSGQVLTTNGSGVLSFADAAANTGDISFSTNEITTTDDQMLFKIDTDNNETGYEGYYFYGGPTTNGNVRLWVNGTTETGLKMTSSSSAYSAILQRQDKVMFILNEDGTDAPVNFWNYGNGSSSHIDLGLRHANARVRITDHNSSTIFYSLPRATPSSGDVLTASDGSGTLTWSAPSGGGPDVGTTTSSATLTAASTNTSYHVTALATNATIAAPSGTPADGHKLVYRFKDDGTARTLTWNSIFRAIGTTIPSGTSAGKVMYVGTIYNGQDSKWDVISATVEI